MNETFVPLRTWPAKPGDGLHRQLTLFDTLAVILAVAVAVGYNAFLAWASARNLPVGRGALLAAEFLALSVVTVQILIAGRQPKDGIPLLLLAFFAAVAAFVSMASLALVPDMVRNAAIIALFFMLGLRLNEKIVRLGFATASLLVAAGLILEIASATAYVEFFQPGQYYQLTRGSEPLESVDGLYRNASGFDSRFIVAELIDHRASSIFLEPVSLGNFGVVLLGFVTCFWNRLLRLEKVGYLALAALMLVASNSRILLAFMLICPIIFLMSSRISRNGRLLIFPLILVASVVIYATGPEVQSDDLFGRVGKSVRNITELGVAGLFGVRAEFAHEFSDSGYAYVVAASSVAGLLALWAFVALIVPDRSIFQRRTGLFLCLYFFLSLLISGTSVFSMKSAALLWLFAGFAAAHVHFGKRDTQQETADGNQASIGWRNPWRGDAAPQWRSSSR